MLLQRLCLVEQACSFLVLPWNCRISILVDHPNSVPVSLCTVSHESFELRLRDAMPRENNIEILPEDALSCDIFRLHVANGDGHNAAVGGVIDMASHGCLLLDTLHMVEHHPRVFEITTGLHPLKLPSLPRCLDPPQTS
jgi:hypothetical protein